MAVQSQELHELSHLLKKLYALGVGTDIASFDTQLFVLLRQYLDFDSAWVGRSTLVKKGPLMHTNILYGLADGYVAQWEEIKDSDALVPTALLAPGTPFIIDAGSSDIHTKFKQFLQSNNIAQLICITHIDIAQNMCTHLSIYREKSDPKFSREEADFVAALMPNLTQAIAFNRAGDMASRQELSEIRSRFAIFSQDRVVQFSSPDFNCSMSQQWPDWDGKMLPCEVEPLPKKETKTRYQGSTISLEMECVADLIMIAVCPLSAKDLLTPRELEVAELFSHGFTYKAVAKELDISPATVRHHLRNVYLKLDIQDKGEIAWLLKEIPSKN